MQNDPGLVKLSSQLQSDSDSLQHYTLRDGLLFNKDRLMLPKTSSLIPTLMAEFHDTVTSGHSGFMKTYK